MPSRSKTSIANLALSWLAGNPVTDVDVDDSREAALVRANYDESRILLLSDGDYGFARNLFELLPATPKPSFGYTNKFLIPADVLVVRDVSNNPGDFGLDSFWSSRSTDFQYVIRSGYIHANADQIFIQATVDITDPNIMTPAFTHMLAAHIGMNLAYPLTESSTSEKRMTSRYSNYRQMALSIDGIQSKPKRITSDSLIRGR